MVDRPRALPEPLWESLRATAKEIVWLTVRYRPTDRPIMLFCTRRGGSTWLMEIIGANRGMLPLNQPLDILTPNLTPYQYRRLPKFDRGQLVAPDREQEEELREYVDDLLAGKVRVNAPYAIWRRDFHFRARRLLLKTVDAKPMMDWFDNNYDLDLVYLIRHPIPQALSCIRNKWHPTTLAYLRNDWFCEEVVRDASITNFARRLAEAGSTLERYVLNWVIENLYPIRALPSREHWLALSYEECVVNQSETLHALSEALKLPDWARMQSAAVRASRSSGLSASDALQAIKRGDSHTQIARWRRNVSSDDLAAVQRILDRFGITLYAAEEPMPNWHGYRPSANALTTRRANPLDLR